ncbi:hypothetical protein [Micromonospora mirobrigensis]|uniref:DUF916 domain-containing protein n=1 Tax=Micromonospora mirobrigensis TaxID=262898 RepID=A0A1C4ZQT7_9ACTN|nr:hypothetical protein [Micromonospora mirobrigensis]SCF35400.1 hypothetical protein GA0070564_106198 [Micromonospora mirobrigensis]
MTALVTVGATALVTPHASAAPAPDPSVADQPPPGGEGSPDGEERASPDPTAGPDAGPATSVGIRLLDAPVARRDDSRARRYIVDHVHPGTTIKRRIIVQNTSEVRRPVAVYAAAADVTKEGFILAPDRTENELSSWIHVDHGALRLDADEEAELLVTIAVPAKAEQRERYAVIWAEVSGDAGRTVRNVGRVGIRVYLSVGPGGEPVSGFEIGPLTGSRNPDGTPVVTADVRNTGKRALDLAGELRLHDGPGGLSIGPVRSEAQTLALGGTATIRVVLDRRVPDGPWTGKLDLASGWTKRGASGRLTFGAVPAAPAAVGDAGDRSGRLLIGSLVGSGLVLVLIVLYGYRKRLRNPVPAT